MAFHWIEDPTTELILPSANKIQVRQVDMMALVMSADNEAIPNGLLEQISSQMSGQQPDIELECHSGVRLPSRGEPAMQGVLRGKVVDVTGNEERFTVRVSMASSGKFTPGEIRFGGNSVATLESVQDYQWRIGGGDAEQARRELPQLGNFINLIVRAASVSPKLVKEVTEPETQWPVDRVTQADKMMIFNWAMPREVRPAGTFPQKPAAGVAVTPDVQGVSPEPGDGVRTDASVGALAVQP
jgi:hypothetical protein